MFTQNQITTLRYSTLNNKSRNKVAFCINAIVPLNINTLLCSLTCARRAHHFAQGRAGQPPTQREEPTLSKSILLKLCNRKHVLSFNKNGHGEGIDPFALDLHQLGQCIIRCDDPSIFLCLQLMLLDVAPNLLGIFTSWSRFQSCKLDQDFITLKFLHDEQYTCVSFLQACKAFLPYLDGVTNAY